VERTLDEMIATLPATQRRAVATRAEALIDEELSLRDLRKALQLTQSDVARRLKKGQDAVSRIEQRDDLLLSTLQSYVAAMNGELEVICRFKDRPAIRLMTRTLSDRAVTQAAPRRSRARPAIA
jgi:transcriptional regulator with XRE-family HTH domain